MNYRIIIAIALPFLLILGALRITAFDVDFYENEFRKSPAVENATGITQDLLFFLKNKQADSSYISSFQEVEQTHLFEVRKVMQGFLFLLNLAAIIFIISAISMQYLDKKHFFVNLGKSLFYGSLATIAVELLLFLSTLFFSASFTGFHKIFFKTQWQFPADYLLIRLFPQQFFIDIFVRIILFAFLAAMLLGVLGYTLKKEKYLKQSPIK